MRVGRVRMSKELLILSLNLPRDTEVREAALNHEGFVTLLVEHPGLPDVPDFGTVPNLVVIFERTAAHYEVLK